MVNKAELRHAALLPFQAVRCTARASPDSVTVDIPPVATCLITLQRAT